MGQCVNCETIALAFCLECKDYLCLDCYDNLHQKGARKFHAPFRLAACSLCKEMPAKLHCNFTDKHLCHACYAMKHVRMLPPDGKENQPRQIDYASQYIRYATFAEDRRESQKEMLQSLIALEGEEANLDDYGSVLSTDWHPFYDSRGVKFYHNFLTGERMRQSPRRVPVTSDPEAPLEHMPTKKEDLDKENSIKNAKTATSSAPLTLTGFDSLSTGLRAPLEAAAVPENRNIRAPHRVHMPNEVPPL